MPPLPVIDDTFRVTLNFVKAGVPSVHNVLHFRAPPLDEQEVGDALAADGVFVTDQFEAMSSGYGLASLTILALDGASAGITVPMESLVPGGDLTQPILELAAVVSLYTAHRGPSGRGRAFIGPVGEGSWNGAAIDGAVRTTMQNSWDDFLEVRAPTALGINGEFVVASYHDVEAYPITSIVAQSYGATQRRRLIATR